MDIQLLVAVLAVLLLVLLVWSLFKEVTPSNRSADEVASEVLASLKLAFAERLVLREVTHKEFPWIDRDFFESATEVLEREGFSVVGDFQNETIHEACPDTRTYERSLLGDGGAVRATVTEMRAHGPQAEFAVIRGLVPRDIQFVSLETELSNGTVVTTSNTWGCQDAFTSPDSIQHERLPQATPLPELIASHRERIDGIIPHAWAASRSSSRRPNAVWSFYVSTGASLGGSRATSSKGSWRETRRIGSRRSGKLLSV